MDELQVCNLINDMSNVIRDSNIIERYEETKQSPFQDETVFLYIHDKLNEIFDITSSQLISYEHTEENGIYIADLLTEIGNMLEESTWWERYVKMRNLMGPDCEVTSKIARNVCNELNLINYFIDKRKEIYHVKG